MSHPTPDTSVSLADYWQMLDRHDWFYDYIDDYRLWSRANAEHNRLQDIADQSPEHAALFDAMEAHGWQRGPLPPQPVAGPTLAQSAAATIGMFALVMGPFLAWAFQ